MNNQQAFEKMITGLRGQGWKQSMGVINQHAACVYRGPGGLKCAVGHIIPDEEYRNHFEGETVTGIHCRVPSLEGVSRAFLRAMQNLHDDELQSPEYVADCVDIVESLDNIAVEYRLHFDPSWVLEDPELKLRDPMSFERVLPEVKALPKIKVEMVIREVECGV